MVRLCARAANKDIRADQLYAEWEGKRGAMVLFKIRFLTKETRRRHYQLLKSGRVGEEQEDRVWWEDPRL